MTSPASISTQSPLRLPSTRMPFTPAFSRLSIALSAIEVTWRFERPLVTTMVSAIEVLPARSMVTVSSAFMSSRLREDVAEGLLGVGALGDGIGRNAAGAGPRGCCGRQGFLSFQLALRPGIAGAHALR